MAKRRSVKSKINKQLIVEAFADMARQKNIDRDLLQGIIEETFAQMVRKKYGLESQFEIIVNMDKGDIEIYLIREVVEDGTVEDPNLQVEMSEANAGDEQYDVGDEHLMELNLENLSDNFGRRMISMAGQTLGQRVREVEKENITGEYAEKVGEIVVGEVYQVRRNDIYVMHDRVELRMPRSEQIWRERYKKGETVRALLKEVRPEEGTSSQPEIIISRSDPDFLKKLMEIEIPEIYDGVIEIKAIAREPGERAKVAVWSHDERVDPVGACVGMKGVRIHSIVRELSNESIDVIPYDPNPRQFIARALSPAKVKEISIDEETRMATVLVADDQVSLAIGRGGQNVRLAMKLTGFTIDLVKEGGEDIELVEFKDELGDTLYEQLIMLDIETAKEFLRADEGMLLSVEGMTPEKLRELRAIMILEFDEDELRDILPNLTLESVLPTGAGQGTPAEEATEGAAAVAEDATADTAANAAAETVSDMLPDTTGGVPDEQIDQEIEKDMEEEQIHSGEVEIVEDEHEGPTLAESLEREGSLAEPADRPAVAGYAGDHGDSGQNVGGIEAGSEGITPVEAGSGEEEAVAEPADVQAISGAAAPGAESETGDRMLTANDAVFGTDARPSEAKPGGEASQ